MRRAFVTVVLAGVLVAAGAVPSMAQMARTFDDLRADALRGEIVSVMDQGGTKVEGRVVSISATSIDLLVNDGSRKWAASDVAFITQHHCHAGQGALIGLAGGVVSAVLLVLLDPECQKDNSQGCEGWAWYYAAFLGPIGAGIGAALGNAIRTERVLYAAPSPAHAVSLRVAPGVIGIRAQLRF